MRSSKIERIIGSLRRYLANLVWSMKQTTSPSSQSPLAFATGWNGSDLRSPLVSHDPGCFDRVRSSFAVSTTNVRPAFSRQHCPLKALSLRLFCHWILLARCFHPDYEEAKRAHHPVSEVCGSGNLQQESSISSQTKSTADDTGLRCFNPYPFWSGVGAGLGGLLSTQAGRESV